MKFLTNPVMITFMHFFIYLQQTFVFFNLSKLFYEVSNRKNGCLLYESKWFNFKLVRTVSAFAPKYI